MAEAGRCIPSILSDVAGAPVPAAQRPPSPVFTPVPPDIDFVALEQAELARWAAHRVFERSVEQREGAPPWVFYEGPPTANGMPGLHHVWARVYKDLFCRFRTMRGSYVARRAGWDTHGLPVEVEVEKKLGITGKEQIETQVGIAEFTRLCRESVYSYVDEFARLTHAHRLLGRHGRGLLDVGPVVHRVGLVAPAAALRPGAALRGPQGRARTAPAAAPRCRATSWASPTSTGTRRTSRPTSGSAWSTADPARWRRRRRVAGRVDDDAVDAAVEHRRGGEPRPHLRGRRRDGRGRRPGGRGAGRGRVGPGHARACPGSALVGLRYERPFDDLAVPHGADGWRVVPAAYVTTEEGTGLVHLAPAFGEIDRQIGRENGLPSLNPVGPRRPLHRRGRLAGRARRARGQPRHQRPAGGGGAADPPPPLRALVPALLALPHAADLLGQAELVHRHLDPQGRPAGGQPDRRLAPGVHPATAASASGWPTTSTGRCRATATGARRCPIWRCGRGPRALRRLAGRAVGPVRARRHGHRPAPADHRRA